MRVRLGRVAAPIVGRRALRADVVSGAEAATLGTQQHDARRWIGIGAREGAAQRLLEFMTDRVELIRPIERHDADFVVNVVKD
jgi:hypothetical protein